MGVLVDDNDEHMFFDSGLMFTFHVNSAMVLVLSALYLFINFLYYFLI